MLEGSSGARGAPRWTSFTSSGGRVAWPTSARGGTPPRPRRGGGGGGGAGGAGGGSGCSRRVYGGFGPPAVLCRLLDGPQLLGDVPPDSEDCTRRPPAPPPPLRIPGTAGPLCAVEARSPLRLARRAPPPRVVPDLRSGEDSPGWSSAPAALRRGRGGGSGHPNVRGRNPGDTDGVLRQADACGRRPTAPRVRPRDDRSRPLPAEASREGLLRVPLARSLRCVPPLRGLDGVGAHPERGSRRDSVMEECLDGSDGAAQARGQASGAARDPGEGSGDHGRAGRPCRAPIG